MNYWINDSLIDNFVWIDSQTLHNTTKENISTNATLTNLFPRNLRQTSWSRWIDTDRLWLLHFPLIQRACFYISLSFFSFLYLTISIYFFLSITVFHSLLLYNWQCVHVQIFYYISNIRNRFLYVISCVGCIQLV